MRDDLDQPKPTPSPHPPGHMSTIGKQVIHSVHECLKTITDQSRAVPHLLDIWRRRWTRQYDC
jgi:hypothetical protein